jgi:hypothetical protein
MRDTIVVAGSLAQQPGRGGHTWCLLQYLLGFRHLGWDVLFLDRLEAEMCSPGPQGTRACEGSWQLRYLVDVLTQFGFQDHFHVLGESGNRLAGISRAEVLEKTRRSAFLLNVMGFLTDPEVLAAAPRRVFLDIDPGFGQMWHDLGLHDLFTGHDQFVTIGENIGQSGCAIPTCGREWITTAPPVVLEYWPPQPPTATSRPFTSVVTWRGPFGPLVFQGNTYGLRVHEFRAFLPLPQRTGQPFELALDIHPADGKDLARLHESGWSLVDPLQAAGDPQAYRHYIQQSRAEFLVAKNMYVQARSGWLSDRSVCYLASGKPVLAQDTGFRHRYPTGEGLLAFGTLDEAVDVVDRLCCNYASQARAARSVAEAYFDSDKVLGRLLGRLGVA